MAFSTYEESLESGQPNELYEFQFGSSTYRFTSGEDDVEIASFVYRAIEIQRTAIVSDPEERNEILTVSMPADEELPSLFLNIVPGQVAQLVIKRYHRTDTGESTIVMYYGRVLSVSFVEQGLKANLALKNLSQNMNSQVPTRTYQSSCNWVLFDSNCGINSSSYRYVDSVDSVSGRSITVSGLTAAKGNGWATGGWVSYGGLDFRFITSQSNDVLYLLLPFSLDVVGKTVEIYAGCPHTINTCSSKFNNVTRFGGCPWVPTKNIFATGLD